MESIQAEPGSSPAIMTTEQYWQWQTRSVYRRTLEMAWVRHGVPELREYAARWPRGQAFVLGTGPSLQNVTAKQWMEISRFFTIGINFFPVIKAERGITALPSLPVPSLAFFLDRIDMATDKAAGLVESFKTQLQMGGKVLVGFDAIRLPYTWTCPTFGMAPTGDLEFGLTTTAQYSIFFSRSAIAMAYLLLCLGFKNVCLLGCDHGELYKHGEPAKAAHAYGCLAAFAAQRNQAIWQCGARAGFDAEGIRRKRLDIVLRKSWEGTRLPPLKKIK